jgi:hypothetical protein
MTDDIHGLGALPSPFDDRDFTIDMLAALTGDDLDTVPPPSWIAPKPYPPQLDQGTSPQCVAFGTSSLKGFEDLRDQGAFDFAEGLFFSLIGGTEHGAVPRIAFQHLLDTGYPVIGNASPANLHKIAAYYRVPVDAASIKAAFVAFGPLGFSMDWSHSWFNPLPGGVLPWPDYTAGGHFVWATGYNSTGVIARNSWGPNWGNGGFFTLPWSMLSQVREVWKAVDQIVPSTYRVRIHGGHKRPTSMHATVAGAQVGVAYSANVVCVRTKYQGAWWYLITSKRSPWHERWFQANSKPQMTVTKG